MHPLLVPQIPAPTAVVSPPLPTIATGATWGTKIRLSAESAATECEPDDCGTFSISLLASASITPSTAACWLAAGQGDPGTLQSRLAPVWSLPSRPLLQT